MILFEVPLWSRHRIVDDDVISYSGFKRYYAGIWICLFLIDGRRFRIRNFRKLKCEIWVVAFGELILNTEINYHEGRQLLCPTIASVFREPT